MFNVYVTTVQLHLLHTYHSHSVYSTSHSPPPSLPRDAQAIDSYEAQGDGQVSFEEGDIIQVLDKIEDGKFTLETMHFWRKKKTGWVQIHCPRKRCDLCQHLC